MPEHPTTILTLDLEPAAQAHFDRLRQLHYPAALNRIPAHLTLFHALPATDDIRHTLVQAAAATPVPRLRVTGFRSLGRGVAYTLQSAALLHLHATLSHAFAGHLSAQDRQAFRPHIVVQNKVSAPEAKSLLATLQAGFVPSEFQATGLAWWDYLGGPWHHRETFRFGDPSARLTTPE